jgi:hypothetical protein
MTATQNNHLCPVCGQRLAHDHVGRGFVRHLTKTRQDGYCPMERGKKSN